MNITKKFSKQTPPQPVVEEGQATLQATDEGHQRQHHHLGLGDG